MQLPPNAVGCVLDPLSCVCATVLYKHKHGWMDGWMRKIFVPVSLVHENNAPHETSLEQTEQTDQRLHEHVHTSSCSCP